MTTASVTLPPRRTRFAHVFLTLEAAALAFAAGFVIFARAGFVGSPISYAIVSGHSMEPALHAGDIVILQRTGRYGLGDVIAYRVPEGGPGAGLIIIHRIVGGNPGQGYVTKGDNKGTPDPWRPRMSEIVGRERLLAPKAGLAVGYIRTPLGFAGIAGLLTMAIALSGPKDRSKPGRPRGGVPSGRGSRIVSAWRRLVATR